MLCESKNFFTIFSKFFLSSGIFLEFSFNFFRAKGYLQNFSNFLSELRNFSRIFSSRFTSSLIIQNFYQAQFYRAWVKEFAAQHSIIIYPIYLPSSKTPQNLLTLHLQFFLKNFLFDPLLNSVLSTPLKFRIIFPWN